MDGKGNDTARSRVRGSRVRQVRVLRGTWGQSERLVASGYPGSELANREPRHAIQSALLHNLWRLFARTSTISDPFPSGCGTMT